MAAKSFGFTKLVVRDLDRIEAFYRDVFGLVTLHRVGTDEHAFALDEAIMTLGDEGHRLVVTRYRDRSAPASGAAWTGFVVEDLDATLADVILLGGQVVVTPHRNDSFGVRAAVASDPEGHLIEIIQQILI